MKKLLLFASLLSLSVGSVVPSTYMVSQEIEQLKQFKTAMKAFSPLGFADKGKAFVDEKGHLTKDAYFFLQDLDMYLGTMLQNAINNLSDKKDQDKYSKLLTDIL